MLAPREPLHKDGSVSLRRRIDPKTLAGWVGWPSPRVGCRSWTLLHPNSCKKKHEDIWRSQARSVRQLGVKDFLKSSFIYSSSKNYASCYPISTYRNHTLDLCNMRGGQCINAEPPKFFAKVGQALFVVNSKGGIPTGERQSCLSY